MMIEIMIDGKTADITLDSEQTLGDVLAGVDEYLERAGFCVYALELDGVALKSDDISREMERGIQSVQKLNVVTRTEAEMAFSALEDALSIARAAQTAGKQNIDDMLRYPSFSYLKNKERTIYDELRAALGGADGGALRAFCDKLDLIIKERGHELKEPLDCLGAMAEDVRSVCERLASFSLDAQTGKDARAAETVEICAGLMQKFFRLTMLARFYGLRPDSVFDGGAMEEFNGVLKEFLSAYERSDIVLSGDLAEYEIAPRFQALYDGILRFLKEHT